MPFTQFTIHRGNIQNNKSKSICSACATTFLKIDANMDSESLESVYIYIYCGENSGEKKKSTKHLKNLIYIWLFVI